MHPHGGRNTSQSPPCFNISIFATSGRQQARKSIRTTLPLERGRGSESINLLALKFGWPVKQDLARQDHGRVSLSSWDLRLLICLSLWHRLILGLCTLYVIYLPLFHSILPSKAAYCYTLFGIIWFPTPEFKHFDFTMI